MLREIEVQLVRWLGCVVQNGYAAANCRGIGGVAPMLRHGVPDIRFPLHSRPAEPHYRRVLLASNTLQGGFLPPGGSKRSRRETHIVLLE